MQQELVEIACNLGAALLAGSLIGMERTFNGRPAGFRTHALVCVASALLMLITSYQTLWLDMIQLETVRTDPTRMAQGIMTGIGFLGAGVIFKEGLTVRGLTTAASIWMTAAIGTLFGIGFYYPGLLAVLITLGTLSLFRLIESKMPTRHYARLMLRYRRDELIPESVARALMRQHHLRIARLDQRLIAEGTLFEYRMVVKTIDVRHLERLSEALLRAPEVLEFQLDTVAN